MSAKGSPSTPRSIHLDHVDVGCHLLPHHAEHFGQPSAVAAGWKSKTRPRVAPQIDDLGSRKGRRVWLDIADAVVLTTTATFSILYPGRL
jgi:hypothetical protein